MSKQSAFGENLTIIVLILAIIGVGSYVILNWNASSPFPVDPIISKSPKDIPGAHAGFGFNAFKILAQEERNKNIFISPASIALALSMVYNGANGETKIAIQNSLQFHNFDIETVNKESRALIELLKNPDPKVEISIANSVWARKDVDVKKSFLDVVTRSYNAEIAMLDFSNSSAANTINAWVSKNTKGKISTIVSPPISDDMMMYLINAVYFKGSWTAEFDKTLTEEKTFTTGGGTAKNHPLMRNHGDMLYLETNDFQSVHLPYGKNKRLSMVVFLPKNLNSFVQSLNRDKWNAWAGKYEEMEGTILLPRFKLEYEKGLIPMLTRLGMGVAFTDRADFTGIGENLFISEVKHKTYVDVNEEGTEAAAFTSIGMAATTALDEPPKKTFYMEVNRPFSFLIWDNQTQEVLFMGAIQNP